LEELRPSIDFFPGLQAEVSLLDLAGLQRNNLQGLQDIKVVSGKALFFQGLKTMLRI